MWHKRNSTSYQFRIFACNSLCRRWHILVYPGFIRIFYFLQCIGLQKLHLIVWQQTWKVGTWHEIQPFWDGCGYFFWTWWTTAYPVDMSFQLRCTTWHESPIQNRYHLQIGGVRKTCSVLLDFSNDSHVWIQTFGTQLDHSGGRWRHRTLPSFKISSLQCLGGGDVASRFVTIKSQLPEAGHIATSWSGHCGETSHEEKGAWCMQWEHGSDDQIDASKVPHTMTVAELKRLAHLLFKQVGHPRFLSCLMIFPWLFSMCFLWLLPWRYAHGNGIVCRFRWIVWPWPWPMMACHLGWWPEIVEANKLHS